MNSSTQQVIAELIGKETYHPLISLRMGDPQDRGDGPPILRAFSLYRKSLQIIPGGAYTLRFAVDGIHREYQVRVANKTLVRADEKDEQAS